MSTLPARQTAVELPAERPAMLPMPSPLWSDYCALWTGAELQASYSPLIREQAQQQLDALLPLLVPVTDRHLRDWLLPIPASVRNGGRGEDETRAWFAAVCLTCAGTPASLFNRASQAEALRTFQFFPSAADVYQLVAEERARLLKRAEILRGILATPEGA